MERNHRGQFFPWYKERLQTKYLKATTNKLSSVNSCYRFVNVSIDDYTDCSSLLSGPQGGVSPIIFHGAPNNNSSQKPRKCISKEHACFSKQMIRKQKRREYVAGLEERLKQHQLAMNQHYRDHMTPELFDKVVSVLEPDLCVNSASSLPTPTGDRYEKEDKKKSTEPSPEELEGA